MKFETDQYHEEEEQKSDISYGQNFIVEPQQQLSYNNDLLRMDTSDSIPRLHTDSSSSEHVLSPCGLEVQSDSKWNEIDNAFFNGIQQFNYMDGFQDDPFASQDHYQSQDFSQDMFMFLQKPF
jgi:hypothetical protein